MLAIPSRFKSVNAILAIAAIVTGALSFWGASRYVEARAVAAEQKLSAQYVSERVIVAARDLAAGTVLGVEQIAARAVPIRFAASDRIDVRAAASVAGRRVAHLLRKGDPLRWSDLEAQEAPTLSARLEPGLRAVTFPVDEVNSFSGLLTPGDSIDLLYSTREEGRDRRVVPLLQSVRVLATGRMLKRGRMTDAEGGRHELETEFVTVTLHVAPVDAARIVLAQQVGDLTAVLRNAADQGAMAFAALDARSLLSPPPGQPLRGGGAPRDYFDLIFGGAGGAMAQTRRIAVLSTRASHDAVVRP